MFKAILNCLKIKHYVKNLVVFIPLIFSLKFFSIKSILLSVVAFIAFCFIASAVYVFNDILDVNNDKSHPIKKKRPIASGTIPIFHAWVLFVVLMLCSVLISLYINTYVLLAVVLYLLLNIWYSVQLKFIPIIDVVCIALGFILRILVGCGVILVIPSPLVILLTFFTSMFFTFSKRKLEYNLIRDKKGCRKSIKEYTEPLLNQFVTINAVLSIAFYFTYMLDPSTIQRTGTEYLYITVIPFSIVVFRLLFKTYTCSDNDDPAEFIYKDKMLKVLMFLYLIILLIVLFI